MQNPGVNSNMAGSELMLNIKKYLKKNGTHVILVLTYFIKLNNQYGLLLLNQAIPNKDRKSGIVIPFKFCTFVWIFFAQIDWRRR